MNAGASSSVVGPTPPPSVLARVCAPGGQDWAAGKQARVVMVFACELGLQSGALGR
jgi:hypothetical protein